MKDVQATEEASSPQKRASGISNNEISLFSIFMGHLGSLHIPRADPNPADHNQHGTMPIWIRTWIHNSAVYINMKKTMTANTLN
jgi:hypothetical protein